MDKNKENQTDKENQISDELMTESLEPNIDF